MAAPVYAKDLTDIDLAQGTASGLWAEPTATGWTGGGTPAQDVDYPYIQGSGTYNSVLQATTKSGVVALMVDGGASGITLPTDGAFLLWQLFYSPTMLETYENNGLRVMVGSGLADFYWWPIGGRNTGRMPYGGWQNWAVNPAQTTGRQTQGAPGATRRYVGCAANLTAGIGKGYPHIVDAARWGRCEARFTSGEMANPATFAGFAALNDAQDARWGLIQEIPGGYLWKGLITIGYGAACYFSDSNTIIFIDDTRAVTSGFNKIVIRQAGTTVNWTGITFIGLGPDTTMSKGSLEVVDDCDLNFDACTFNDMEDFTFQASSEVFDCIFRRCGNVTANGANLAGSLFEQPTLSGEAAVIWNVATDPNTFLEGCSFVKGSNDHHAIEFGLSSPTAITLTDVLFDGFNAGNGYNDSAIHFLRTGGTITLTITGGTSPSYKSAGATIDLVTSSRDVTVVAQEADGTPIYQARVLLKTAADATGGFPYDDTVTIVNSGDTATVTHTSHGMKTNDKVVISGASLQANNGVFTITKINDNSYYYTMGSSPGSSPTGTIKCSFVFLEGLTDVYGEISMSREIGATQLVTGWARKSSSAPYYKQGPLSGSVITTGNSTFTAILSPDE
jgi:hypothetical protein